MKARKKILALGPQNVCPPIDGGKESIYGALSALAHYVDICYVYPAQMGGDAGAEAYAAIGVAAKPIDYFPHEDWGVIFTATLSGRPYKFEKYSNKKFCSLILKELGSETFDGILCFHSHVFRLAELIKSETGWDCPIVLREHNIEYGLVSSYRESLSFPVSVLVSVFENLTVKEEQRAWGKADLVAFITDADLSIAQKSGVRGNFIHAPEGTPIPELPPSIEIKNRVILLLNPKATQSVASMKKFVNECWIPCVEAGKVVDVTLSITGVEKDRLASLSGVSEDVQSKYHIQALGFLPNLKMALMSSLALVSPTYVGGGIRKKILEGMAHAVPVIATDLDVQSCSYFQDKFNILKFVTPTDFSKILMDLKNTPEYRKRIANNGRETAETKASWNYFGRVMRLEFGKLGLELNE